MSTTQISDAERLGRQVLRQDADDQVVELAARLVLEGKARWVFDPEVDHVVGLLQETISNPRAYVVVYLEGHPEGPDFEVSDDLYQEA